MRILTMSYEFPPLGGGGSKVAQGLASELARTGHAVDVITMGYGDLPRNEEIDGVRVSRMPCIRKAVDVSHPHELASYMIWALPAALKSAKNNSYDIIHCHFIVPDGVVGIWPSRRSGIPLVVTAHGSDVPGYNPDRFKSLHSLISPAWRAAVRAIDQIVSPSDFLRGLLLQSEPGARVVTVPNGFDLARFDDGRERSRSILVVSRMLERKGVQDVFHALAGKDFGFELNVVGTGPYLDTLVELSRELGLEVNFHGWLDNDSADLKNLFETSEIFVFPSLAENFPMVLLEAMAAGLAIVTTNQTGCLEVVGDAALCVAPGDRRAIGNAVETLATDQALRRRFGRAARDRLVEHFNWPVVARQYVEVFEDAIARTQKRAAAAEPTLSGPRSSYTDSSQARPRKQR